MRSRARAVLCHARAAQRLHPGARAWQWPHAARAGWPCARPARVAGPGRRPRPGAWHRPAPGHACRPAAGWPRALAGRAAAGALGPARGGVVVTDQSGPVLSRSNAGRRRPPASTTKLLTAVAALGTLGPDARFTTRVVSGAGRPIVLVGGGDPTLAARSAASAGLPAARDARRRWPPRTAAALRPRGIDPGPAGLRHLAVHRAADWRPGWTPSYISTGNVTPITSLEVDQGRLTPSARRRTPTTRATSGPARSPGGEAARRSPRCSAATASRVAGPSARAPPTAGAAGRRGTLAARCRRSSADAAGEQQRASPRIWPGRSRCAPAARLVRRAPPRP